MRNGLLTTIAIVALAGVVAGCSSAGSTGTPVLDKADHERAIARYSGQVAKTPDKPELWRGLGIAYYQADSLDAAARAFDRATQLQPNDASSVFYRAMIAERKGNLDLAKTNYRKYLTLKGDARLQSEAKKRLRWMEDDQLKKVVTAAIQNEKNVNVDKIPGNTAAIVRFETITLPQQYRSLGRGVAELIYSDLSNVPNLTLVERLELSTLQKELSMSQTALADKFNSPRIGRLVGASKVITGQLNSKPDNSIELDAGIIDVGPGLASYPDRKEGKMSEFFKMQKQLSFDIIAKLGYEITPDVRNAISKPATESMLALIAYSRGMEYVDQGLYSLAEAEFTAALSEDPGFALAKDAIQDFGGLGDYDGKLRPVGELAALVGNDVVTPDRADVDLSAIIERLQDATRGAAPDQENPYVAPRNSSGAVVVRGRTD
ncbi:MAG: tetratricopeptide repeat protein [Candidatus Zixiibacteriota bacterium]